MPQLINRLTKREIVNEFLLYLRSISGEDETDAQMAINSILSTNCEQAHSRKDPSFIEIHQEVLKEILLEILKSFTGLLGCKDLNQELASSEGLISEKVETILLILRDRETFERLVSKQQLEEISSYAILLIINEKTLKLVGEISRHNVHSLGVTLEKKLIILISRIITGSRKIANREASELKGFLERF